MRVLTTFPPLLIAALALLLAARSDKQDAKATAADAKAPPPVVSVVTVEAEPLTLTEELPGRLEATRIAEVRARASGIVLERTFEEGSMVEAGEILFRIDPAPMQAALSRAEASLAKAEASLKQARVTVERYTPLVKSGLVSRHEYDSAVADQASARADVAGAEAALETAELNLEYTTVEAPIAGRIGRALVTVGALVGQGEATPLAVIQQFDPIYANLTQSSDDVLRLRRALASGQLQTVSDGAAKVRLVTEDGRPYPHAGTLLFTDMTVDPSTGAVTLRAEFPNPAGFLLPGMYVRAQLEQAVDQQAITIPQQALKRTRDGAVVMVVGDDEKVEARPVTVGRAYQNRWVITEGLTSGDNIIVEGLQKAEPGSVVAPAPWKDSGESLAVKKPASGRAIKGS